MAEFNQAKYIASYNKSHYDAVTVRFPTGGKDLIKAKAADRGMSISAYLWWLVQEDKKCSPSG